MKNWMLFIALLVSTSLYTQNDNCGFKEKCDCDTSNESVEHSFNSSAIVIKGRVLEVDTVLISEIINPFSISKLKNDTLEKSKCAKSVLISEKIIRIRILIIETFKGDFKDEEIYIITPLKEKSCRSDFNLESSYTIYATKNETADIYFIWTFDEDYFHLKQEYTYWTNKCKRTALSEKSELEELKEIKKSLTKPKLH